MNYRAGQAKIRSRFVIRAYFDNWTKNIKFFRTYKLTNNTYWMGSTYEASYRCCWHLQYKHTIRDQWYFSPSHKIPLLLLSLLYILYIFLSNYSIGVRGSGIRTLQILLKSVCSAHICPRVVYCTIRDTSTADAPFSFALACLKSAVEPQIFASYIKPWVCARPLACSAVLVYIQCSTTSHIWPIARLGKYSGD